MKRVFWQRWPQVYRYMLGGFVLTLNAGFVNGLAILSFRQPVSHLTGIASNLGIALVTDWLTAVPFLLIGVFFVWGSAVSGIIIDSTQLRFGRRYGVILLIEAGLLAGAAGLLTGNHFSGLYLATMACGLQNGMVTTYSDAIVRTSHITGLMTDLGIYLGKAFLRHEREQWRLQMYLTLLIGFVVGGGVAKLALSRWGITAMYGAAGVTAGLGFVYSLWRQILGMTIAA